MGRILQAPPLFKEGAGSPSNTKSPGLRGNYIPSGILMHLAVWPQYKWAEIGNGASPPFCGGAGSPSNTNSPGLRPTTMPSAVLIHPAVWPQ